MILKKTIINLRNENVQYRNFFKKISGKENVIYIIDDYTTIKKNKSMLFARNG
jgi:hypothetical protein